MENVMSQDATQRWVARLTRLLTAILRWVSAHWLLVANAAVSLYLLVPILAPLLMANEHTRIAAWIYTIFRPLCHQLPERSFFLFGEQAVYSYDQLYRLLGALVPARFVGNAQIGFKIAICQRDVAIYAAMLLAGLAFGLVRGHIQPLAIKRFVILIVPMAVDGLGQLFRLWTSTWWSRVLTGGLFGIACVWLVYPYLERGMADVRRELNQVASKRELSDAG